MTRKFHGIYDSISDTYKAVLTLIGTGYAKDDICVVMSRTLPSVTSNEPKHLNREERQKSLLESVFPLHICNSDNFSEFPKDIQRVLRPYLKNLEQGKIVLLIPECLKEKESEK